MPPASLLIGAGGDSSTPGFAQQGQVDWVAFGQATVHASLAVMQRLSAVGVQPVTYAGGLAMASRFKLGEVGRRRMDDALQNLSGRPGLDSALYFGFGYRSFVQLLAETQYGIKCVALCACLAEMHHEAVAGRVLTALWKAERFPEEYEPSYVQFTSLIKACAGVVTKTSFGQTADIMLGDLRKTLKQNFNTRISAAGDIARAIHGLFEISSGAVESITVIGGAECSFIAALAEWLFNFTTHIEDCEGNVIFTSSLDCSRAQVYLRYAEQDILPTVLITSTTYILGDYKEMLVHTPDSRMLELTARTPWDNCLTRVFGSSLKELLGLGQLVGDFLGSAARIYRALAKAEHFVERFSRRNFVDFVEASYGQGFVESVGLIFPELDGLHMIMERASQSSLEEAISVTSMVMLGLKRVCSCYTCRPHSPHEHASSAQSEGGGPSPYDEPTCLPSLMITISHLVTVIASLEREPNLHPTISGLEEFYRQKNFMWRNKVGSRNHAVLEVHEALSLDVAQESEGRTQTLPAKLIAEVQCLFTGYMPSFREIENNNYRTAVSESGICIYIDALESMTGHANSLRRIHVMPGHIECGNRPYDHIWDSAPIELPPLKGIEFQEGLILPPDATSKQEPLEVKSLVSELPDARGLAFSYKVSTAQGAVLINPGMTMQQFLQKTGFLSCDKRTCQSGLAFPCTAIRDGWMVDIDTARQLQYSGGISCCIWTNAWTDIYRCLIVEALRQGGFRSEDLGTDFFVRRDECFPCCTESILRMKELFSKGQKQVIHIV